jgi:hypothetical protein
MNQTLKLLVLVLLSVRGSVITAQESRVLPIVGDWHAASRAFWGLKLQVDEKTLTFGDCDNVPYIVLINERGYGQGTEPLTAEEKWQKIAIELRLIGGGSKECSLAQVLEFSIPDHQRCHAQIGMFLTREDFENAKMSMWGVWGKKDCLE